MSTRLVVLGGLGHLTPNSMQSDRVDGGVYV